MHAIHHERSNSPFTVTGLITFTHMFSVLCQVVYAGSIASIPVAVTAGTIPVPGSVDFEVELLTAVEAPILALQNGVFKGSLVWDAANGTQAAIVLPIDWPQVCPSLNMTVKAFTCAHVVCPESGLQFLTAGCRCRPCEVDSVHICGYMIRTRNV